MGVSLFSKWSLGKWISFASVCVSLVGADSHANVRYHSISYSPSSVNFGSVVVGSSSNTQTLTMVNNGRANLVISAVQLSSGFQWAPATPTMCVLGSSIAPGASCTMAIYFAPQSAGALSGSLTLTDNLYNPTQVIPLSGTGVPAVPALSHSPSSVNFGNVSVGSSSGIQTLTMQNSGNADLVISTIALSNGFSWGPDTPTECQLGGSLAPGASCTMAIYFAPQSAGSLSGSLTLTDNASISPVVIALAGSGVASAPAPSPVPAPAPAPSAPILAYSPSSLNFGNVNVGSVSSVQTLTMMNSGSGNLTISSAQLSGNFTWGAQTATTCVVGGSMAPGSTCTMAISFAPQSSGSLSGSLTLTDNTANSTKIISLMGSGVATASSPTAGLITIFTSTPRTSFDIGGISYEVQDAGQSYSMEQVDSQTLRFEVQPGDQAWFDGGANLDRSEVQMNNQWAIGTPITIEYQFMLEPGATDTSDWFVVSEMHNDDVNYATSPPVSIMLAPGDYFWVQGRYCATNLDPSNSASNQVIMNLYTAPTQIVRGQWYDIKLQMNVNNDSSGYLYVWIDGNQVVNYNGPLGYGPTNGPQNYWEEGLYRDRENIDTAAQFRALTISPAPTLQPIY